MSRRRSGRRPTEEYPPQLAEFDVADWWVADPEDPTELTYARIRWEVARSAYRDGEDWESHLLMPAWWAFRGHDPNSPDS